LLQKCEFHATFRDWIDRVNPRFSAEVAGAFADDGRIAAGDFVAANAFRESASKRLDRLLDGRRVLCMPTSPILPIGRDAATRWSAAWLSSYAAGAWPQRLTTVDGPDRASGAGSSPLARYKQEMLRER
jgi:hypothetical protein